MSASCFGHRALLSQRSSGYKNTTYALAELIDNAFDAFADEVRIILLERRENNKKYVSEILICDDGHGMTKAELQLCLQFGGGVNTDIDEIVKSKKRGKFGYGLPNASLSQCPCVQVINWQAKGRQYSVTLDLERQIADQSVELPPVQQVNVPPYYLQVGGVIDQTKGVIVAWQRCDRLMNTRANTIIDKSEELLGRLFRYLIANEKKRILLQAFEENPNDNTFHKTYEKKIVPNDPLFLMENTVIAPTLFAQSQRNDKSSNYYKKFSISKEKCQATNVKLTDHCFPYFFEWKGKKYKFQIKTSVASTDIQKPGIREGGSTDVGKFYGKFDSISFVRADREISSGSYGFYRATEPRHRWWNIEISFEADADDLLGVHNNKQGIEFTYTGNIDATEEWDKHTATLQQAREKLWSELTKRIEAARKEAWKIVLKAQKEFDLRDSGDGATIVDRDFLPGPTEKTQEITESVDGKRERQFTSEERSALLGRLKEKYPSIEEDDIRKAIDRYDSSLVRGCVLYHDSESDALWSLTTVFGFLIVLINTQHVFYQHVIAPLRQHRFEAALAAIELFISSLAWEENQHFGSGEKKNILEEFRSYVGLHLGRYIRELNITDSDFMELARQEQETDDETSELAEVE